MAENKDKFTDEVHNLEEEQNLKMPKNILQLKREASKRFDKYRKNKGK